MSESENAMESTLSGLVKTLCDAIAELIDRMRERYTVPAHVEFEGGVLAWKRLDNWTLVVTTSVEIQLNRKGRLLADNLPKELRVAAVQALPELIKKLDMLTDEMCKRHIEAVGIVDECHKRVVGRPR